MTKLINIGIRRMLATALAAVAVFSASAQQQQASKEVNISFANNSSLLMRDFRDNATALTQLDWLMGDYTVASQVDSIVVVACSSPEGNISHNYELSYNRAVSVRGYIMWKYPYTDRSRIILKPRLVDWETLEKMVNADINVPYKWEVLALIRSNVYEVDKVLRMREIGGGMAFRYITDHFAPALRSAATVTFYKAGQQVVLNYNPNSYTQAVQPTIQPAQQQLAQQGGYYTQQQPAQQNTDNQNVIAGLTSNPDQLSAQQKAEHIKNCPHCLQYQTVVNHCDQCYHCQMQQSIYAQQANTQQSATNAQQSSGNYTQQSNGYSAQQTNAQKANSTSSNVIANIDQQSNGALNSICNAEWIRKPLIAVKTNLLFDAATMLNVGLEIPIGRRWSINAEYTFPWWLWEHKQICIENLSGSLEARYWFGNRNDRPYLTGWFAGLYAGGGYFDFEWKTKGYQGEFFIAAGISVGYAHTINKSGTLRMEYSLGIGYMQTDYREYIPQKGLDNQWHLIWQSTGTYKWFGPTAAKVSLVWLINHGYERKGGR